MALHGHVKKAVKKVASTVARGAEAVADVAASAARATTIKPKRVARRGSRPAVKAAKAVASVPVKVVKSAKKGVRTVESNISEALAALKEAGDTVIPGKGVKRAADRINEAAEEARRKRRRQ